MISEQLNRIWNPRFGVTEEALRPITLRTPYFHTSTPSNANWDAKVSYHKDFESAAYAIQWVNRAQNRDSKPAIKWTGDKTFTVGPDAFEIYRSDPSGHNDETALTRTEKAALEAAYAKVNLTSL